MVSLRSMTLGAVSGLAALVVSASATKAQTQYLYDDFSSGSLDTSKWEEVVATDIGGGMLDEHFVEDGVYHTAQLTSADRGTALRVLNRAFLPGEGIEYDVQYIGGSGNRISTMMLNNNAYRWAFFGWWNGVAGNNDYGLHHIKVEFQSEGANVEMTRPNGDVYTYLFDERPASEYTFGIVTRTGDNGTVHMNIDNVYLTTFEPSAVKPSTWSSIKNLFR